MKKCIWTMGYFPFTIGGSVNQPMMTKVKVIEECNVGKGLKAFSFKTPKGSIRIAESVTGAIVGDTFEQVKKDISEASKKVLDKQIKDAKDLLTKGVKNFSNKQFFELYKY